MMDPVDQATRDFERQRRRSKKSMRGHARKVVNSRAGELGDGPTTAVPARGEQRKSAWRSGLTRHRQARS
jgi:hypothetical protein